MSYLWPEQSLFKKVWNLSYLFQDACLEGRNSGSSEVKLVAPYAGVLRGERRMTMTDPISDMLTRIRNSLRASHELVDIPTSKLKIEIAKVLKSEGYIRNLKIISDGRRRFIRVFLKYDDEGMPVISGLQRVSKPSCRIYSGYESIPKVLNGYGINILSTSKGIITDRDARKKRIGGEVLCSVW
jgi:small subunit ribosomal protein S8